MDADEDSAETEGGINKGKPNGRKKKGMEKKRPEASSLREKIDDMVKNKELFTAQQLSLAEKKQQEKEATWLQMATVKMKSGRPPSRSEELSLKRTR